MTYEEAIVELVAGRCRGIQMTSWKGPRYVAMVEVPGMPHPVLAWRGGAPLKVAGFVPFNEEKVSKNWRTIK